MFWILFLVLGVSAVVLLSQQQSRQVAADLCLVALMVVLVPFVVTWRGIVRMARKAAEIVVAAAIYLAGRVLLAGIVVYDFVRPRWRRVLIGTFLLWTVVIIAFTPIGSLYRLATQTILVILAFAGLTVIVAGMYQAAYKPGDESSLDDDRLWSLGLSKVWALIKAPFVFLWEFAAAIWAMVSEAASFILRRRDEPVIDNLSGYGAGPDGRSIRITDINDEVDRVSRSEPNQMGCYGPQHR
jgi:hypothetical protein